MATPRTFLHFSLVVYRNLTENNALEFQLMMVQQMNFSRSSYFYGIGLIRLVWNGLALPSAYFSVVCILYTGFYVLTAVSDEEMPGEVIHHIAGLQISGFVDIVRTLLEVYDAAEKSVKAFCEGILKDLKDRVVISCIEAVQACYMLREQVQLDQRIFFIHIGV